MPHTSSARRAKSTKTSVKVKAIVRPRVKIWLEVDGNHGFCAGMYRILEAIEQCGSIKEAAELVGLSYRHVWSRLKNVEAAMGRPLVDANVGGHGRRTELSETGRLLMTIYGELVAQITAASDASAERLKDELSRVKGER